MLEDIPNIDFNKFVSDSLHTRGFQIFQLTREFMETNIQEVMEFVNKIRVEFSDEWGWKPEGKEYFLNGLVDKWKYSYVITGPSGALTLINFSSLYTDAVHMHCTYTHSDHRCLGLGKLHMLKLCETGIENGISKGEGFWPKKNSGSIILHLQMGWKIDSINDSKNCVFLIGDLEKIKNITYRLLTKTKIIS